MKKKQITIIIISVILILLFCIIYTMSIRTSAVADIISKYNANNLTIEDIKLVDSVYNKTILIDLCIFSILQVVGLAMYLFKKKKGLTILLIVEIILFIISLSGLLASISVFGYVYTVPIINTILYLIGLKTNK